MALLYAVSMNNSKEQRGRKEKIKTTTSFFLDFTSMLKQGIIMQKHHFSCYFIQIRFFVHDGGGLLVFTYLYVLHNTCKNQILTITCIDNIRNMVVFCMYFCISASFLGRLSFV